jgi:UDP-GlcNAc:undecaprenyl-phosphate GlcNAc-1-phosphate transferase
MILAAIIAFTLAFLSSLALAPVVRLLALRVGLTDDPDGNRKLQSQRVALGGGLVVYLSVAWVVGLMFICAQHWLPTFRQDWSDAAGFAAASTILVLVGLVDDRFGLRGRHKLLGQLLACSCLMGTGLVVERIGLFGMKSSLAC